MDLNLNVDVKTLLAGLKGKKGPIIIILSLLITVIVAHQVIYQPQMSSIRGLKEELEIETAKSKMMEGVERLRQAVESFRKRTSENKDTTWVINKVNRIAEEVGVDLLSIEPLLEENLGLYLLKLPVKIQLGGSYRQINDFINRVESSEKFLRVDELDLEYQESKKSKIDKPLASITLSTIYLKKER